MGKNTLYKNCDTLGVLQNLEEKFDLIYLDAPYFSGSWEIGLSSERKSIRLLIAEEKSKADLLKVMEELGNGNN